MSNWDEYTDVSEINYLPETERSYYNSNTNYYQSSHNDYGFHQLNTHYYNTGDNRSAQGTNATTSSTVDISKSTLTPTAKEFKPSTTFNGTVNKNTSSDNEDTKKNKRAVNKYRYDRQGPRYNYNNTRTFHNTKIDQSKDYRPNKKSYNERGSKNDTNWRKPTQEILHKSYNSHSTKKKGKLNDDA